ncbi:hypothetical protein [Leptolyngbya sp. 7M]|uniref:hypothetical protein n=1 Tax=Leptolyngbya sp. 7M TaxID=2812896 RepID=UPI001B8D2C2A|nr:hypothetical protein [Leptolyngbya sp. 7M]QYO68056.1 hypothetical protein JVX88_15535 [Leptolyngbya sp. 7M]
MEETLIEDFGLGYPDLIQRYRINISKGHEHYENYRLSAYNRIDHYINAGCVSAASSVYAVELVVTEGKKSVETDAEITFGDSTVRLEPDKQNYKGSSKEFAYSEIKNVDYSYAKKPMFSGGGAIATALLVGFIVRYRSSS